MAEQKRGSGVIGKKRYQIPELTFDPRLGLFMDPKGTPILCLASLHLLDKKQQVEVGEEILRKLNGITKKAGA